MSKVKNILMSNRVQLATIFRMTQVTEIYQKVS